MYVLRRFAGPRFERLNAIIDGIGGSLTAYISLVGSASLPLPEVCRMSGLPGTGCRVEGHLGERFFPRTDPFDEAEELIEEGVRKLFGLGPDYGLNGQPHSATQANHAAFQAALGGSSQPIAALAPVDGGHISHRFGAPNGNEFVPFPLRDEQIDYGALEQAVERHQPALLVAGGTSYARKIDYERLREIADRVGGHLHADLAHTAPFVAAGLHPAAFPHCDSATLDTSKGLRGPRGGILVYRLERAREMRRAIFPILQSSPSQGGLMAKAACMLHWSNADVGAYAETMIRLAVALGTRLERVLGPPIYGGTDTHLLTFDVTALGIDGLEAEDALTAARILVNRNQIPGDTRGPQAPSGIRLSSTVPAILGYNEADICALGDVIASVLTGEGGQNDEVERLLGTYHQRLVSIANESTSGGSSCL